MREEVSYMVDTRGRRPDLVRCRNGIFERYNPSKPEVWTRSEFLDAMSHGGGDWVWFDDISEDEAKKYMKKIEEYDMA